MNSPHHPHHEHHDVHQQRLLWFFSFCNQRSSSSSSSSSASTAGSTRRSSSRRKSATNRNKFAIQYQQQLQQQQRQSSNVFGRDLIEHTQTFSDDDSIPHIVKSCTRFIEKHGIIFGIYRLSGMRVNIHKLRQDFDKNPKISMIDSEAISNDAHAVACVLKQYFRELPTPLLTFHMYERFIELFKHCNQETNTNNNNNSNINNNNTDSDTKIDCQARGDMIDSLSEHQLAKSDTDHDINNDTAWPSDREGLASTKTSNKTTSQPRPSKQQSTVAITRSQVQQSQFTTSASDSQLLSLSSMVTTTNSDIKYLVKLEDLRQLLLQLPRAHYQTLKFLMRHLACIAANGQKTGMDSKNVAIVWAPNLLKPRELELSAGLETLQIIGLQAVITEQLIKHHKFLFGDEENNDVGSPRRESLEENFNQDIMTENEVDDFEKARKAARTHDDQETVEQNHGLVKSERSQSNDREPQTRQHVIESPKKQLSKDKDDNKKEDDI